MVGLCGRGDESAVILEAIKIANKIGFGSKKKKNKQSEGFFDMAVTYLTKKVKEITD